MNSRRLGIVLGIVGILLVSAPFFAWPNYGETPYYVTAVPVDADINESDINESDINESDVIAYEMLPPTGQESFDNPVPNHSHPMYSEQDSDAIQLFTEYRYVEVDGKLYEVSLEHHDGVWIFASIIRLVMFGSGGVLAAIGGLLSLRDRTTINWKS